MPAPLPPDAEILLSTEALRARVQELGAQISREYTGTDLILLCILRGGVIFLADLMREITIPFAIDFMALSSYESGVRQSTGKVRITLDLKTPIAGRDVLVVEDIVDSGCTLAEVLALLRTRQPKSLHVCVLLDKAERREAEISLRYIGFSIPDSFVFGYGMDIDEQFRQLPCIAMFPGNRQAGAMET